MRKKIKLMVVAPYFYPKMGGLENYAFNIAKGLKNDYNYNIIVVTSNHEDKAYKEETLEGIKIYRLPRQFKVSNTPISFKWKKQIKEIIEKEKPDVINAHSPVPFISDVTARIANKLKIPFVLTYHTGSMKKGIFYIDWIISIYESFFLKKTFNNSSKIIATSSWVSQTILKDQTKKRKIITPAVDIRLFFPDNKKYTKNKILFVANLNKAEEYKGLGYLLYAIIITRKKIKDINLSIVGDGNYLEYYKKLCLDLNISQNVEFKGRLYGKKLVEEYQKTNAFILPSSFESFGMVLIEAMACKKPAIGSNIGGIPYVINNNINGLLVPPKNSQALAEAIIKILKNPKLAKQMGENGYKKVKANFTWDKKVKETNKIILEILRWKIN